MVTMNERLEAMQIAYKDFEDGAIVSRDGRLTEAQQEIYDKTTERLLNEALTKEIEWARKTYGGTSND